MVKKGANGLCENRQNICEKWQPSLFYFAKAPSNKKATVTESQMSLSQ